MKYLNFARFKFLRFIYLSFLLSLLVVVFCGFAPAEVSAATYPIYSSDFIYYTYSVPEEHVVLSYTDSDVFQTTLTSTSYGINSYRFTKSITFDNTVPEVLGVPYYITVSYDFSDFNAQYFTLVPNGQAYTSQYGSSLTADRKFTAKTSVRYISDSYNIQIYNEPSSNLSSGVYTQSFYYVPYYNNSYYYSNTFVLEFEFYMNTSLSSGVRDFSGIDYSISIVPVYASDYLDGFEAGQIYANSVVNENSASYIAGINQGLDDAKDIVDVDSASYRAGFLAGTSLDYNAGYLAGIDYANSIVNVDSISYKQGYQDGLNDGLSVGAGFAQNGLFYNSTLTIDMTLTTDDGEADKIIPTFQLLANPFLLNYSIDFAQLRSYLESNYLTPTYEVIKELTITVSFDQDIIFIADVYRFYGNFGSIGITGYFTDNTGVRYVIYGDLDGQLNSEYLKEFWYTSDDIEGKYITSFTLTFKSASITFEGSVDSVSGGYQAGYISGYNDGKFDGSKEGYQLGYDKGVNSIKDLTELEAFQKGYDKALADNPPGLHFNTLLAGISDSVVGTITGLLDFEILGVNLMSLFGSVLVILIATFIIRRFI